jgi:hypothetical protein
MNKATNGVVDGMIGASVSDFDGVPFLQGAVYQVALSMKSTPRTVLDQMFKSVPSDDEWTHGDFRSELDAAVIARVGDLVREHCGETAARELGLAA